jgi:beta-lactam-binding protein with PASTA domain
MTVRTRIRHSLPWAIVIIGGFLSAYLLVAFVVFPSGLVPRDVSVPNVVGLSFDDAARRLATRGLRGIRGQDRFHGASPKGTVLEQTPHSGAHDVEGATVTLVLSGGPQMARVPGVVGMARDEAESALDAAGFDVGEVTERVSPAPRGQVIESQPAPEANVSVPATVALVVSAGQSVVAVPNVVGRSFDDASRILEQAGLTAGTISAPGGRGGTGGSGVVTAQSPAAGTQVSPGARILLQITP